MKVLLIAPHAVMTGYSRLFHQTDEINLGLLTIAAACREKGHDAAVELLTESGTEACIRKIEPDVVGISTLTPTYRTACRIALAVKRADPRIVIVLGGHHVSALPEEALAEEAVDYVVRGEGEEAFPDLLAELAGGNRYPDIAGVCYLDDDGQPVNTGSKAVVEDLDALPFMDQTILGNERVFLVSSRGCPFSCDFCSVGSFYERRWRKRSVESIAAELRVNEQARTAAGKEMSWVDFRDDNLTVDALRLEELCRRIGTEGWRFTWHCQSRSDTVVARPDLVDLMAESGCAIMALGLESGLQEILDVYRKGITPSQSLEAAGLLKKRNILHIWYAMLGSGDELDTPELLRRNIEALAVFPFDLLQVSLLTPFPGTPLYGRLAAEGRLLHRNWDLYDGLHCVYRPLGIEPEAMEKILLWAYRRIFVQSGLRRIIHTIRSSRPFWGNTIDPRSLFGIARDMILLKKDIF